MMPLSKRVKPFVTSKGVMIGINYVPRPTTTMSQEDEFWQGVMLGIEPDWSRRRIAQYLGYIALLCVMLFIAFWKAKETLQ